MSEKYIYGLNEGNAEMKALLGGKGANLAEMVRNGLPVPPGFVITTEVCLRYMKDPGIMDTIWDGVKTSVAALEKEAGKAFNDPKNPLLVSVRSGSRRPPCPA